MLAGGSKVLAEFPRSAGGSKRRSPECSLGFFVCKTAFVQGCGQDLPNEQHMSPWKVFAGFSGAPAFSIGAVVSAPT
jgi:hypothetical protein